ncbi:MAG: DUF4411 family protein [Candidatus Saccharibacteria bacterium]|nr:DUF4411 family protein [Candidatus Saccharibacteria bacterium]MCY4088978.1 DUF4411 family protein [Candidatus Saccharibacteria bacterium]
MNKGQGYVLDTNAILDLTRRLYPELVFPNLHSQVSELVKSGFIISSVEVLGELGIDFKKKPKEWLNKTERDYPREYNLPILWSQKYSQIFLEFNIQLEGIINQITSSYDNVVKFQSTRGYDADIHLIALAVHHNWALITSEKTSNNADKPNIPDICKDLGVSCMDLLGMFKTRKWSF